MSRKQSAATLNCLAVCLIGLFGFGLVTVGGCASSDSGSSVVYVLIAADANGDIYRIDSTTGAATLVLDTNDGGSNAGAISSMIWFPDADRIWLGMGGNSVCGQCIMELNKTTGSVSFLGGSTSGSFGYPGLSFDSTGNLFTIDGDSSTLESVDTTTGAVTTVGSVTIAGGGGTGNGMTLDAQGRFYLASGQNFAEVDTADATNLAEAAFSFAGFAPSASEYITSMTTHPTDGTIYGLMKASGQVPGTLVTANPATGVVTFVASTAQFLDGLVFVPDTLLP